MFSAFKKLTTKTDSPGQVGNSGGVGGGSSVSPGGMQSMSHNLQKKFSKGCNYNLKIVIRGDKNTGKSSLLQRLQGGQCLEEYQPTEEIQVASINWSYKNTDDVVKVEVWDVVDVAKKRKKLTGLKIGAGGDREAEEFEPGLDAQFLDVYKQTNGVIIVFDITKPWTFEYMKNELKKVPATIPVIVLANFSDIGHHRQVTKLQISDFIENFAREGTEAAEVRWAECSMRNGFGLKLLHKFINVPFLLLQRQSLLQQLELNSREIVATQEELDLYMESDDANYETFSESLTARRRQAAEQVAPPPAKSIVVGQPSNCVEKPPTSGSNTPASLLTFSNKSAAAAARDRSPAPSSTAQSQGSESGKLTAVGSSAAAPSSPLPGLGGHSGAESGISGAGGGSVEAGRPRQSGRIDVDSFVPDAGDFDNFLEEDSSAASRANTNNANIDSSDDEDLGNPMVSKFEDEIECEDYTGVGEEEEGEGGTGAANQESEPESDRELGRRVVAGGTKKSRKHKLEPEKSKLPALTNSGGLFQTGEEEEEDHLEDFLGEEDSSRGGPLTSSHDGYDAL